MTYNTLRSQPSAGSQNSRGAGAPIILGPPPAPQPRQFLTTGGGGAHVAPPYLGQVHQAPAQSAASYSKMNLPHTSQTADIAQASKTSVFHTITSRHRAPPDAQQMSVNSNSSTSVGLPSFGLQLRNQPMITLGGGRGGGVSSVSSSVTLGLGGAFAPAVAYCGSTTMVPGSQGRTLMRIAPSPLGSIVPPQPVDSSTPWSAPVTSISRRRQRSRSSSDDSTAVKKKASSPRGRSRRSETRETRKGIDEEDNEKSDEDEWQRRRKQHRVESAASVVETDTRKRRLAPEPPMPLLPFPDARGQPNPFSLQRQALGIISAAPAVVTRASSYNVLQHSNEHSGVVRKLAAPAGKPATHIKYSPAAVQVASKWHISEAYSNEADKAFFFVFDTSSLLRLDDHLEDKLDAMTRRPSHCTLGVPFSVLDELDGMIKGFRKHHAPSSVPSTSSDGVTMSENSRGAVAMRARNWITEHCSTHQIRLQQRSEIDLVYNMNAIVADDRILGFAVFLKREKLVQGQIVFVTEDKMLKLKAMSEHFPTASVGELFSPTSSLEQHRGEGGKPIHPHRRAQRAQAVTRTRTCSKRGGK